MAKLTDWRIIDTAPKDGTRVKLLCPGGKDFGFFDTEWSTEGGNGEPLLWAPANSAALQEVGR
jgi:hypothetical protein